jgi:hypothetical protein
VAMDNGFMVNPIHEFVIKGGGEIPAGTEIFELTQQGERIVVHQFGGAGS